MSLLSTSTFAFVLLAFVQPSWSSDPPYFLAPSLSHSQSDRVAHFLRPLPVQAPQPVQVNAAWGFPTDWNQSLGLNQLPDSYTSMPFAVPSRSTLHTSNVPNLSHTLWEFFAHEQIPNLSSTLHGLTYGHLVGIQGLTENHSLNGKRGEIIGVPYSEGCRVNIFGYGEITVKNDNIYVLDKTWNFTTKTKRFDQRGMMEHFGAPGLLQNDALDPSAFLSPPPLSDFTHAKPSPLIDIFTFWGPRVFEFMTHRADTLSSQMSGYLASTFRYQSNYRLAMVLCIGTRTMQQQTPLTRMDPEEDSIWWPALCAPTQDPFICSCYCQAQALSCSTTPWPTHATRIVFLDLAPQIPLAPSSVTIEELPDDQADAQPQTMIEDLQCPSIKKYIYI